jgi:hypothetical protein
MLASGDLAFVWGLRQVTRPPFRLLIAAALAAASPAFAHHSFAAYESDKTLTLTATVESFGWANPHATLQVAAQGTGDRWAIETSSPSILERFGWKSDSLKPGDRISVVFNPMRDGSHQGRLHTVVLIRTGAVLRTKLSGR